MTFINLDKITINTKFNKTYRSIISLQDLNNQNAYLEAVIPINQKYRTECCLRISSHILNDIDIFNCYVVDGSWIDKSINILFIDHHLITNIIFSNIACDKICFHAHLLNVSYETNYDLILKYRKHNENCNFYVFSNLLEDIQEYLANHTSFNNRQIEYVEMNDGSTNYFVKIVI